MHHFHHTLPSAEHFLFSQAGTAQWRADAPFHLDMVGFEQALVDVALAEQKQDEYLGTTPQKSTVEVNFTIK